MTEQLYTPHVTSDAQRRLKGKLHFSFKDEEFTRCGLSTEDMDSGCLDDDMTREEVLVQQDPCQNCINNLGGKPFQLECKGCGKKLESNSWRGMISALRRHAVKHKKKEFPLGYLVTRVSGRQAVFK